MVSLNLQLTLIAQLLLSLVLGGMLGYEREIADKSAGIRTFAAVCTGSCLFGILSLHIPVLLGHNVIHNPTRIAAQVVTGIGFLGAGVMFREGVTTKGLTTAATLWASAAIGVAVAFSLYLVAIITTLLLFFMLFISQSKFWLRMSPKRKRTKDPR